MHRFGAVRHGVAEHDLWQRHELAGGPKGVGAPQELNVDNILKLDPKGRRVGVVRRVAAGAQSGGNSTSDSDERTGDSASVVLSVAAPAADRGNETAGPLYFWKRNGACRAGGGAAGGAAGSPPSGMSPAQINSESWPQPVLRMQSACISAAVQRRALASAQMVSASSNVLSSWQPPISGALDSVHGQLSLRWLQPPMNESEQQRTSCCSVGLTHPAGSSQRPSRPQPT